MDKLRSQLQKVVQLIFSADTGAVYRQALGRTWSILRETAMLLWLLICLVFVGGEWLWHSAIDLGHKARLSYEHLRQPRPATPPLTFRSAGRALLSAGGSSTHFLLTQAKQQLGMPVAETAGSLEEATAAPSSTADRPQPVATPATATAEAEAETPSEEAPSAIAAEQAASETDAIEPPEPAENA